MNAPTYARPAPKQSAKSVPSRSGVLPPQVQAGLRSPGQPLDAATREFMEPRFGHDFGNVRIHTDANAMDSAQAVNARAYTVGRDVVFGANQFSPATTRGRELLAHELAHTIQQRSTTSAPPSSDPNGAIESSANAAGRDIASGQTVARNLPTCGVGLSLAPTSMHLEDDDDRARQLAEARKRAASIAPKTVPKAAAKAPQIPQPEAPVKDPAAERAAAVAEALAQVARMDQEEKKDEADAKAEAAERDKPVSYLPTTLSSIKPGMTYPVPQYEADKMEREDKTKKDDEEKEKAATQQKEDEDRDVRFMTLRTRLRHGAARSVWAEVLTEKLTPRDRQILKRYGLKWTRRGPDPDSIVEALDKWAASAEPNRPDPKKYAAILQSEKIYFQRAYADLQRYKQRVGALASSGPASLAGRVIGTIIGGEKGGEIGALIGGGFDATLPVYAGIKAYGRNAGGGEAPPRPVPEISEPFVPETTAEQLSNQPRPATGPKQKTPEPSGIPEPITEEATTQPIPGGKAKLGEVIGDYQIFGEKGLKGDTFEREVRGLYWIGPKKQTIDIRPIVELFDTFISEAKAAGASQLRISGQFIANKNVFKLERFVAKLNGTIRTVDALTNEIIIPVNP